MKLLSLITALVTAIDLFAQQEMVEVKNEPRHHLVFENESVRILNVFVEPGDTTLYHRHNTPSVFIFLSTTQTGSQLWNGQPVASPFKAGTIIFDSLKTERIHRVWNIDTGWLHVMDVEITAKIPKQKLQNLESGQLSALFKEAMLNGYKLSLAAKENLQLPNSAAGYLLVSLGDAELTVRSNSNTAVYFMKAGHYVWTSTTDRMQVSNTGNKAAAFALLQF